LSLRNRSWRDVVKVLTNHYGFRVDRQKGDHIMLIHDASRRYATVPRHDPIKERTLKNILYQAYIEEEDFLNWI
jgi:predicted RNA binding protein YcfA (HicA-like mRNA interferase family)